MPDDLRDQLQRALGATYALDRELGGGGMSRVFIGEETSLARKVTEADQERQIVGNALPDEAAAAAGLFFTLTAGEGDLGVMELTKRQ